MCFSRIKLIKAADDYAEKAEKSAKPLVQITKSNSLRRSAKEKDNEITEINAEISEKLNELKTL